MPTDKYSVHLSSRKFLFATDRDPYRKPQPSKLQSCRDKSQLIHLHQHSEPKFQGSLQKRGQKDNKRSMEFAVGLCLLEILETTSIKKKISPTRLPKLDLNKNNIYRHANTERGMFMTPQSYTKNYR